MRETAVKAAGEEVATEEVAHEKVAAEESATVKVSGGEAAAKLEKVAKVKTAAENSDPEKDAAANDELNVDVATTSCAANLTCDAGKNADHQYVAPHIPPSTAKPHVVAQKHSPAPLPLCHYCCHRGSGEHPVHYYPQCLCMDRKCTCQCYCTEDQLNHRKKLFPEGYCDMKYAEPKDRVKARSVAEARAGQYGHRPCESDNCVTPFS